MMNILGFPPFGVFKWLSTFIDKPHVFKLGRELQLSTPSTEVRDVVSSAADGTSDSGSNLDD
jgi:hypothetical protein